MFRSPSALSPMMSVCVPLVLSTALAPMAWAGSSILAGIDTGTAPQVTRFNAASPGIVEQNLFAFDPAFRGGVRVALADINRDGIPDLIAGSGPGGSLLKVLSGADGAQLRAFYPFSPSSTGGIFVAAGDVTGDGVADLVVGADSGTVPHVKVFDGVTSVERMSFLAYDVSFTGGVRVGAGDIDGDGRADIVTGAGAGGGPHVKVFSGASGAPIRSFFAFALDFTGGVYVAAGDVNGDGLADLIAGTGSGGGPQVKVLEAVSSQPIGSFFAYTPGFTGGVRVAAVDVNGDGRAEIVTGPGAGSDVRIYDGGNAALLSQFFAFSGSTNGTFVAGTPVQPAVKSFKLAAPAVGAAGSNIAVQVTAVDLAGNTVAGYSRTIRFVSTGPQAILPANYTFAAADAGTHSFSVTPQASGNLVLSVQDTAEPSVTGSATVNILPAPPAYGSIGFRADGKSELAIKGTPLAAYTIEAATNLVRGAYWEPLATNALDSSGVWKWTDPLQSNYPLRFYRPRSQ